jgi:hypothetical protein
MYHLVTGRPPFEGDTPSAVMHKHLKQPLFPPTTSTPRCRPASARSSTWRWPRSARSATLHRGHAGGPRLRAANEHPCTPSARWPSAAARPRPCPRTPARWEHPCRRCHQRGRRIAGDQSDPAESDPAASCCCGELSSRAIPMKLTTALPTQLKCPLESFIGTGIMGKPMAGHLLAGGRRCCRPHPHAGEARNDLLARGASGPTSPAEAARPCGSRLHLRHRYARCRAGCAWRARHPRRRLAGTDRDRSFHDLPHRHPLDMAETLAERGVKPARCPGQRRRHRRPQRHAVDHGRRR